MLEKLKNFWLDFEKKNPKLSQWVREGGLFLIISNLVTVIRGLLKNWLMLIPAIAALGLGAWGWPNATFELFGKEITFMVIGFGEGIENGGGLAGTVAFWIASFLCEALNFFMQRKFTFRSNGNLAFQGSIYFVAWCFVTLIVNSVFSIASGLLSGLLPQEIINVAMSFLQGGISMVIFFFVNKIIFTDKKADEVAA